MVFFLLLPGMQKKRFNIKRGSFKSYVNVVIYYQQLAQQQQQIKKQS